jgi:chemotaxis-related protein WspD
MEHFALTIPDERTDAPQIDACWNRIGIYGSKDCPELAAHSHCRNCPVFSRNAALLLDRALPDDDGFAAPLPAATSAEPTQSLMVFRLGAEWFAFPTLSLDEIVGLRPVHSLPHRRNPGLLGLVNVRGELVVCVSLARLVLGEGGESSATMMMVARHDSGRFAFPVDEVAQTVPCAVGDLKPVPATLSRATSSFTRGLVTWRDRSVGCLDEGALFAAFDRCLA